MWFILNFIFTSLLYSSASIIFKTWSTDVNSVILNASAPTSKYTLQERIALEKFRPMVIDILGQEYERKEKYLIRWLRTCDLDLLCANTMLREAQRWRRENQMDTILNETTFQLKGQPCLLEGTDREGNPIAIVTLIGHDVRKLMVAGHRAELVRYMNQFLEQTETRIRELADTTGKDITQAVTLIDANGYNPKQHACIKMYMEFLRNFEKYFPELNRYVVIINAPIMAKPFIDMAKTLLSKNSQRAVQIFGVEKRKWYKFLSNIIDDENLPIQFGGIKKIHQINATSTTTKPKENLNS